MTACIAWSQSPPYWGLRDYGTASWDGGDPACDHLNVRRNHGQHEKQATSAGTSRDRIEGGDCHKCGARRIDQQIGLEPAPDAWAAKLVEVFREVRRVLRPDGCCFVNVGNSFAGSWGNQGRKAERGTQRPINGEMLQPVLDGRYPNHGSNTGAIPPGTDLKPKDLIGQPWLLAFALRQPYYTGRIKSEADRIWLAAMIDAEGCMFIHRRKAGQHNGQGYQRIKDSFGHGLEVANTNRAIVERCLTITGMGSICSQSNEQNAKRKQTIYRWNLRTIECRDVIREVYPHLIAKQHQARLLCGCPSSGDDAVKAHLSLIALHRGKDATIDFNAPASMFEPGWWVRSEVIWSKLNPMPESVTDRPTKAHETVFLLTKSARYFWDAEAVREANTDGAIARFGKDSRISIDNRRYAGMDGQTAAAAASYMPVWQGNGRNLRSVWTIATKSFPEAHFATFPTALAHRCILAGTSAKGCCPACGARGRASSMPSAERIGMMGRITANTTVSTTARTRAAVWATIIAARWRWDGAPHAPAPLASPSLARFSTASEVQAPPASSPMNSAATRSWSS